MKALLLPFSFVFLVLISCQKDTEPNKELTLEDFKNSLKIEMKYDEIVSKFGEPAEDIGSGIHIYVFKLPDETEIWIGYANQIIYARHMDENEELLETIL